MDIDITRGPWEGAGRGDTHLFLAFVVRSLTTLSLQVTAPQLLQAYLHQDGTGRTRGIQTCVISMLENLRVVGLDLPFSAENVEGVGA